MTDRSDAIVALNQKIDSIWEAVGEMRGELREVAHVLYKGNGDSLTTRMRVVETRCGDNCPVAMRVEVAERALDDTRRFRRQVGAGLVIASAAGIGTLILALITALGRLGVL